MGPPGWSPKQEHHASCLGESWGSAESLSPSWDPAYNTGCPMTLLTNSGCMSLTPGGFSVGLPSACVLRNLVSGNFSGHTKRLVLNFKEAGK